MGFKKNELGAFYRGSRAALIATWIHNGITDRNRLTNLINEPQPILRASLRTHIQKGVIEETNSEWRLTEVGRKSYQRYVNRRNQRNG